MQEFVNQKVKKKKELFVLNVMTKSDDIKFFMDKMTINISLNDSFHEKLGLNINDWH